MNPLQNTFGRKLHDDATKEEIEAFNDKNVSDYKAAMRQNTPNGRRLAIVCLKTLRHHDGNQYNYEETAAKFTDDPFEALLVGYAMYWLNDLTSAAFTTLGIEDKTVHKVSHLEANAKWFQGTVDALPDPTKPFPTSDEFSYNPNNFSPEAAAELAAKQD